MARDIDPKCKKCRRIGEKLFLKGERCYTAKCAMVKRNYPPGMHGPRGRNNVSGFGLQLKEKQKAKRMFGILEKQFHTYYEKALKSKGNSGAIMLQSLEKRLDNVLYRAGFCASRDEARQLVNHGHLKVNNKNVNIPSYQVRVGDQIVIKDTKIKKKYWEEKAKVLGKKESSVWLGVDKTAMSIKVLVEPGEKDFEQAININQIIEFYSK